MAEKKKRGRPKAVTVKRPRQKKLPGMEDDKIDSIENAALDYAAIRDQRQALTAQEVPAKQKLLSIMKNLGRNKYQRNGIKVERTFEKEGVKVRVKKQETEAE
jgi:hypothetical protein